MNRHRRNPWLAILGAACWTCAAAASGWAAPAAGTAGAFLKLGTGARALALGGAYTAVPGDVGSAFWNPAGLASVDRQEFAATYTVIPEGGDYSQFAYVLPLAAFGFPKDQLSGTTAQKPWGALGVSVVHFAAAYNIEARQVDSLNPNYLFSDIEGCYSLGYGTPLPWGLAAGVTLKGLYHLLDQTRAGGWGLDAGISWAAWDGLTLALAARDAYTQLAWASGYRERFPTTCKLGASYQRTLAPLHRVLVTADAEQAFSSRPLRLRAGVEYGFARVLFARGGYADGFWSLGGGAVLPWIGWAETALRLDYAAVQDPIQAWDHWLTLNLEF